MSKRGTTLLCSSDCGQQLARIKQQQAALLSPHRNTASPNPALSPNSSRTSPIPGLVPGLAKLGIQDSPHSPRPGLEDGLLASSQPSPGSCKPRQTARDILATSHYNQTSRDNLSPHRKEDSRENFNQSVRSNLSHHPREGSWDYLSVRDNLSPQKRDNLSPHQRQNSKDRFLPPQQRLSSKDNLLLSQRHKDNLSMHPFPRPGSASSGDCNGGYHGRQGSGDSGRGYNHVRHGSGSSGDSLPPPVQTHHSRAASYSTIV